MRNAVFFAVVALLFIVTASRAEFYVKDNADILKNPQQIENEIADLVNKDVVVIIVETENFAEERPRVVYDKFLKHGLDKKGKPSFNMVLVLNVGANELYYRVSKGCELQEEEISVALNNANIRNAYSSKDYDKTILEAVKNLKSLIRKKLENRYCPLRKSPICKLEAEEPAIVKRTMNYKYMGRIKPAAIVLHYTDFPDVSSAVARLEEQGLSTQLMIDRDGTVYQLTENIDDMAQGTKCANAYTISIEIVGNEKSLLENKAQYNSVVETVKWLAKKYDIDLAKKVASRPQKGLLGHSEVAALCPGAEKKVDPGENYMKLVRGEVCPVSKSGTQLASTEPRGVVIDLAQKLSGEDTARIESSVLDDERWKEEPPNMFLMTKDSSVSEDLYSKAFEYAEDSDAECIIVADINGNSVSFSRQDCTLSEGEFQDVLLSNKKDIASNAEAGNSAEAMKIVASKVAEEIYTLSKENEEQKLAEEESLVSILSGFFNGLGSSIYGIFVPASTNPSKNYEQQAKLVMQRAAQFPPDDPRTIALFESAKRRYSPTQQNIFDAGLQKRLVNWHTVLRPEMISFKLYPGESPIEISEENLMKQDFTISIPKGTFCRIIITNYPSEYEFGYDSPIILERNVECSKSITIKIGIDGDCFIRGTNTCEIVILEGFIDVKQQEHIFSIDYEYKITDMNNANKIAKDFIKSMYIGLDISNRNSFNVKINPEEIYAISMGEGIVVHLRTLYVSKRTVLYGYTTGLDTIGDRIDYLKQKRFIREDFDLEKSSVINEKGEVVTDARFNNIHDVMEATAAMVALSKAQFLQDAANLGINIKTLSRRQVNFWTYYYFNCGERCGFKQLRKFAVNGKLQDESFINAKPGEQIENGRNARHNSIIRAVMMEFIYDTGIFSQEPATTTSRT